MNMFSNTAAVRARTKSSIQPFSYPELSGAAGSTPELATANSQEAQLQREQAAHASGLREGELQALVRYEQTIQECRSGLAETLAQFAEEIFSFRRKGGCPTRNQHRAKNPASGGANRSTVAGGDGPRGSRADRSADARYAVWPSRSGFEFAHVLRAAMPGLHPRYR